MRRQPEQTIYSVPIAYHIRTGQQWRKKALEWMQAMIKFLEEWGLTKHPILKKGERVGKDTEILSSHLTDEGYQVANLAMKKWWRALENDKALGVGLAVLCDALAKVRSGHVSRAPQFSVTKTAAEHKVASDRKDAGARDFQATARGLKAYGPEVHDKAKWHFEGEFPEELHHEQAFVYTGMLITWLAEKGFVTREFVPEANRIRRKEITGKQAYQIWDGALDSDMLTEEGNRFVRCYFPDTYDKDYQEALCGNLPTIYHVEDTWRNYDRLKTRIEQRYQAWRKRTDQKS